MKIPDILYSGLGWSVVLLSRREALSPPPPSRAVALIGLPLAFPYPRARSRSPTRSHAHAPHAAHPSYPYHIFLHIIPLFSGATPSCEKRVPRRQKSLMRQRAGERKNGYDDTKIRYGAIEAEADANVSYCHRWGIILKIDLNIFNPCTKIRDQ